MANGKPNPAPTKAAATAPAKASPNPNKVANDTEKTESKSIVPSKYAGRYKADGDAYNAPLATFIRAQCGEGDKFEFPAFFKLCELNGIPDEQIAKYKGEVDAKTNGANGRARMTLANMLRAKARKEQKLKGLNGKFVDVLEPAIKPSGAVAAKKEAAAAAAK